MLQVWDCGTQEAADGKEALRVLEDATAKAQAFSLLLLDDEMSDMSALALLLRAERPG